MVRPFRVFLPTEMSTDCDVCGKHFDLVKGGVCQECRRVLCPEHLHGSWTRRLLADLGAQVRCNDCRAKTNR